MSLNKSLNEFTRLRTYERADCVVFHKTKDEFGGLSNMAGGYPLRINGTKVLTSEALYQACRFPHLADVQRVIISQNSPMTAKMKSKPYRSQSRPDWDYIRPKIMRWCLRVKLAQHYTEFGRLLRSTGNCPIVEQSSKDDYWGAKVTDDNKLVGENVLGRLLMELRERLLLDVNADLKIVDPLPIENFYFLGAAIQTVTSKNDIVQPGQIPLY